MLCLVMSRMVYSGARSSENATRSVCVRRLSVFVLEQMCVWTCGVLARAYMCVRVTSLAGEAGCVRDLCVRSMVSERTRVAGLKKKYGD